MNQHANAIPILLRIGNEFDCLSVHLELLPEYWHVARPGDGLTPKSSPMVSDDVVKGNYSTVANQLAIGQVIVTDAIVCMIPVDKKNVQRVASRCTFDSTADSSTPRVSVDKVDIEIGWRESSEKCLVANV